MAEGGVDVSKYRIATGGRVYGLEESEDHPGGWILVDRTTGYDLIIGDWSRRNEYTEEQMLDVAYWDFWWDKQSPLEDLIGLEPEDLVRMVDQALRDNKSWLHDCIRIEGALTYDTTIHEWHREFDNRYQELDEDFSIPGLGLKVVR